MSKKDSCSICFCYFQVVLLLLVLLDSTQIVISGSTVTSLPGFTGDLPFDLETGYIGIDNGESLKEDVLELFYYFVKSERDPKEDPLLLWHTGGPGCSVFSAFIYEIGPLYFDVKAYINGTLPTLILNPNSWTKVASIIFVDAPVGTGFSYSKTQEESQTGDLKSAKSTSQFLKKWLIEHPEFLSNTIYIGGDSYAGKIVPIIVHELVNDIEAGKSPSLNLKGYLIGNAVMDRQFEKSAAVPFSRGMGLISEELYELMVENCKGGKYISMNLENVNCSKYRETFEKSITGISGDHILEPDCALDFPEVNVDIRYRQSLADTCEIVVSKLSPFPGCRNYNYLLSHFWANDHTVRKALHIKKGTTDEWIRCIKLPYNHDVETSIEYHRNLSMKGYRSLIYSGDHDITVSHISTEAWIRSLNLSITDDWRPWFVHDQVAGYTRSFSSGLTYATVKGGGHTAPEYKPEECFVMFDRWLSRSPL